MAEAHGEGRATEAGVGDLDLLRVYFDEVGAHELLTPAEEVRLAKAIEDGRAAAAALASAPRSARRARARLGRAVSAGVAAREEFATANLRLVVSIAKRYRHRGIDFADLIQEGNVGLMRAIDRFDWRRGYRFSTYATWWIRKSVSQVVGDGSSPVHLPRHRREQAHELAAAAEHLARTLGRQPGPGELAAATGMRTDDVAAIERAAARVVSLSTPIDDNGNELADVVADPGLATDERALGALAPAEVEHWLATLPAPAARVLRLRYGIGSGAPRPVAEVAATLSVSAERVRQIEQRALATLRHSAALGRAS